MRISGFCRAHLKGAWTTGNAKPLISGPSNGSPGIVLVHKLEQAGLARVTAQSLTLLHIQHPHAKLAEVSGPCVCPSSLLHPYSPTTGPFHTNQKTLIVLQFPPTLGLTRSVANGRWAACWFHRKAPGGVPHVSPSSVRDPRPDSFLPPR